MKKYIIAIGMALWLLTYNSIFAFSAPVTDDISTSSDESMSEDLDIITTNEIANWPTGPELNAKAAVLIEANTGVVLYAKNMHKHMYPASTTKLMTALIAAENSDMNEDVSFSYDAVFSLEPGSSNIGIDPGQSMPMRECLYGIMVGSANEVSNAIAEHVAGSIDGFADMMNAKVKSLGLNDTHFTNPNGLHNEDHYTSAYDLAIIAREFFKNDELRIIGNTPNHHFEATSTQPDDFYVRNKHQLINKDTYYEGVIGGKTGYTSVANECLVTGVEKEGIQLICVIMGENSPEQFSDTVKLFDYGYSNFIRMNVSENETSFLVGSLNIFPTSTDILGNSKQLLQINKDDYIIMPINITFKDLERLAEYDTGNKDEIVHIKYSYHDAYLGYGKVIVNDDINVTSPFDSSLIEEKEIKESTKITPVFINLKIVFGIIAGLTFFVILIVHGALFLVNYNHGSRRRRRR